MRVCVYLVFGVTHPIYRRREGGYEGFVFVAQWSVDRWIK